MSEVAEFVVSSGVSTCVGGAAGFSTLTSLLIPQMTMCQPRSSRQAQPMRMYPSRGSVVLAARGRPVVASRGAVPPRAC